MQAADAAAAEQVRAKFGARDNAEREVVRELLLHTYHSARPEKAKDVDALLGEWEGEERLLLAKVKAKYQGALGPASS